MLIKIVSLISSKTFGHKYLRMHEIRITKQINLRLCHTYNHVLCMITVVVNYGHLVFGQDCGSVN